MKVLISGRCHGAMQFDEILEEGVYPGTKYIGPERNSNAYEMDPQQACELMSDAYYRTDSGWDNGPGERAAFKKLAEHLRARLEAEGYIVKPVPGQSYQYKIERANE